MNTNDLLILGIELCVALAAFSGIIVTSQYRNRIEVSRGQFGAMTVIVIESFFSALMCALPIVLSIAQVEEEVIWTACSLLFALTSFGWVLYGLALMRGVKIKRRNKIIFSCFYLLVLILGVFNILNAFDVIFHRLPDPYIIGILSRMSIAGYFFIRLLVNPLWKMVDQNENGEADQSIASSS